jgi:hypothetical protein
LPVDGLLSIITQFENDCETVRFDIIFDGDERAFYLKPLGLKLFSLQDDAV